MARDLLTFYLSLFSLSGDFHCSNILVFYFQALNLVTPPGLDDSFQEDILFLFLSPPGSDDSLPGPDDSFQDEIFLLFLLMLYDVP